MIARPGSLKILHKNPDVGRQDLLITAIVHTSNTLPNCYD
ncbi:hypothetical protein QE439_003276 [Pedobacter agri]|nr:hypothetical protein [Pedobacter agri]